MRALIIGGSGFIGKHIVRRLASHGHDVIIFHRGQTPAVLPDGVRQILDPLSALPIEKFPPELLELEPDVVIHTMMMGLADAHAFVSAFAGKTGRLVVLSSGDVYRAYGRLIGIEPGPIEEGLLTEDSPLRRVLFLYRSRASSPAALEHWYDKILAEQTVLHDPNLPTVVLRLPKVYGKGSNENLATVYRYRHQPHWRWTHGHVENVAVAIELQQLTQTFSAASTTWAKRTPQRWQNGWPGCRRLPSSRKSSAISTSRKTSSTIRPASVANWDIAKL